MQTVGDKNIVGGSQNQLGATISRADRVIRGVPSSHEVVGVSPDVRVNIFNLFRISPRSSTVWGPSYEFYDKD